MVLYHIIIIQIYLFESVNIFYLIDLSFYEFCLKSEDYDEDDVLLRDAVRIIIKSNCLLRRHFSSYCTEFNSNYCTESYHWNTFVYYHTFALHHIAAQYCSAVHHNIAH